MITATELLRASALDLRRITGEARHFLVNHPAPAEVEALRGLRVKLVAELARFQQLVHLVLSETPAGDLDRLHDAIGLKIEAIALARAYDEFRLRWMVKQFTSNWAEYRLSASRMINTILAAIAPVDLLPLAYVDAAGQPEREAPIPKGIGGSIPSPGDTVDAKSENQASSAWDQKEVVR